ncbi:MAG: C13 family peptidase [Hyphomonadaceae bacterium]
MSALVSFLRRVGAGLCVAVALASPGVAQQADPFRGNFGAIEAALPPAEAARQAELMAKSLEAIAPERKGVTDTYVLAASLWSDPVFEREASEGAKILARRFDAEDRTIILSAGTGGVSRTYPVANPNNINAAIGKIGATINPDEDLVVVFITSHGSPDGSVAMQEFNRLGGALRPHHLRNALNAAGVKKRVVIVSACFSGHFILPFYDDNSLVLTAAAADRSSFGCTPENEWTYFGDALFNHALRSGEPLVQAFDTSLGLINKWEDKLVADYDAMPSAQKAKSPRPVPSNPQKHVGEAVAPLVLRAQGYGLAVECAGTLSFALDRLRSNRPLKGETDAPKLEAARDSLQAQAMRLGEAVQRTPTEVAKAIAGANRAVINATGADLDILAEQADTCARAG